MRACPVWLQASNARESRPFFHGPRLDLAFHHVYGGEIQLTTAICHQCADGRRDVALPLSHLSYRRLILMTSSPVLKSAKEN